MSNYSRSFLERVERQNTSVRQTSEAGITDDESSGDEERNETNGDASDDEKKDRV